MQRLGLALLGLALASGAAAAAAQDDTIVLVIDAGDVQLNQARLTSAIAASTRRELIRMTDERAPLAHGRLSIAFQRPNRWVLRYEAGGQVAWITDRVESTRELRDRLTALASSVVAVIDGQPRAAPAPAERRSTRPRSAWDDDIILALRDELVDPFAAEEPRQRDRRALLWSEVVDPFASPSRTRTREVWSEVLDPWASEARYRR
ncbi:MAG: hypothetical protein KF729_15885 [Sandaracinaceae bacterium]|nr:hypothetical protein [Sandaracinaceae bacterium]